MTDKIASPDAEGHSHVFLGAGHERNERKTWVVIGLCSVMMLVEIVGGSLFGSLALVADGLHMSTHAAALLIAAMAYTYARRRVSDPRFAFGTGKFGDLAAFTSAIVLAMIALLIGYEAAARLIQPIPIDFDQAIPIAVVGLLVNIASAWILSGSDSHAHSHGHHAHHSDARLIETAHGTVALEIFEDGVPPRFRISFDNVGGAERRANVGAVSVETVRPDGQRQVFTLTDCGSYLEGVDPIPEPHEFTAIICFANASDSQSYRADFVERARHGGGTQGAAHHDNNMRAAFVHVAADAAVSVLAIIGLSAGRLFGWIWMDPIMGLVGAVVIASWSYGLVRAAGGILLDMTPDDRMAGDLRRSVEVDGDRLIDFHLWRLEPGHFGTIMSIVTEQARGPDFYRARLSRFPNLSHVTIEVRSPSLQAD